MEAPLLVLLLLLAVCQLGVNGSSVPRFLPASGANKYIYATRAAAAAACANASHVASAPAMVLCKASQLTNHSMCEAGWLADGEGYWMAKATAGCGGAGVPRAFPGGRVQRESSSHNKATRHAGSLECAYRYAHARARLVSSDS